MTLTKAGFNLPYFESMTRFCITMYVELSLLQIMCRFLTKRQMHLCILGKI
jgi:hypothetical protein